jgi:hypothetical protein
MAFPLVPVVLGSVAAYFGYKYVKQHGGFGGTPVAPPSVGPMVPSAGPVALDNGLTEFQKAEVWNTVYYGNKENQMQMSQGYAAAGFPIAAHVLAATALNQPI